MDGRADIYSLGCSLYYLLTGRAPFPSESLREKWRALGRRTEAGADKCPEVPDELAAVLHKMMAKSPKDRYQTADEVVAAFQEEEQPKRATVPLAL